MELFLYLSFVFMVGLGIGVIATYKSKTPKISVTIIMPDQKKQLHDIALGVNKTARILEIKSGIKITGEYIETT